MKTICFLFVLLIQSFSLLFGLEIKDCYIKDKAHHESNQKILKVILDQELSLSNGAVIDQASYLSGRITEIAMAMIKKGFSSEAYGIPEIDQNSIVSFNCFVLWEGDKNDSIPLTFFIYIWPSEKFALQYHPSDLVNSRYASIIHSHPIPCAFAVLEGTLIQNNYERLTPHSTDRNIRFINEEIFRIGEGDVDDLKEPFIHKLYNRDSSSKVCISLHAYGLSSEEKVMKCFQETYSNCSYDGVPDG